MATYNMNSGYGAAIASQMPPRSPNGRVFIVGNATIDNIQLVQGLFKHDSDGVLRYYSTIKTAIAAAQQYKYVTVTASASADNFTTASPHGLNNGEKVVLGGTTAPTSSSLGVVYYVVGATATTFQISTIRGGTAIDLGSAGTSVTMCPLLTTGDTIYVLPGHGENLSAATTLDLNVGGISLIGLGSGETRPTLFIDTATTALLTISAPMVTIENFIIDGTGYDAVASMISITSCDATLRKCKFYLANATNQATLGILTNAKADRLTVEDCVFIGTVDAGTATAIRIVGGDQHIIQRNIFIGAYTTTLGAVQNVTTACTNAIIQDNFVNNLTASSAVAFTMVSTSTGAFRRNNMQVLTGTAPIVAAAMSWVGSNYYAATIATAGTLI